MMFGSNFYRLTLIFLLFQSLIVTTTSAEEEQWKMAYNFSYPEFYESYDAPPPIYGAWYDFEKEGWFGPYSNAGSNPDELCQWYGAIEQQHFFWSGHADVVFGDDAPSETFRYVKYELIGNGSLAQCFYEHWSVNEVWAPWPPNPIMTKRCQHSDTFGCGKSVKEIKSLPKKSPGDPTRLFHENQICIAEKSCDLKCEMENCKWLDLVIPDFIDPYIQKNGSWEQIESDCRDSSLDFWGWASEKVCANAMARYHISEDLIAALSKNGCGTDSDWSQVFDVIKSCNRENLSNLESRFANLAVKMYRNAVRDDCIKSREAQMKPIEIDLGLEGRQCFVL
ncbi:hypothetical protein [Marinagarivorans cellulosilyticus]|uniref:Uncharacterized protein n=1 Tax=Marinagarivorans cellulosilyticus TaxID=2721545 RepID=A0AAN1WHH4_9GAMM|nr:hypothetical protein [Marinagarivorans cellulosilyticus]BCD97701.1 hypothetical protein MARGE09_P1902 [Marinagarivorans cellulosilyticus]